MEEFVTYEQAVKLKELGFDCECLYYYQQDELCENTQNFIYEEEVCIGVDALLTRHNIEYPGTFICSAPTLAQAAKWLREKWNFLISIAYYSYKDVDPNKEGYFWDYFIREIPNPYIISDSYNEFDTYESALSAGIDAALKLIDENNGNKKCNTNS